VHRSFVGILRLAKDPLPQDDKGVGVVAGLKPCPSTVLLNFPDANRAFGGVHGPTRTSQKARR
jgi:hypothetical protein